MTGAKTPRKDQARNHQQLVTAARDAFLEHGVDVSLDDIAARAGVGPSTLYRHFPDRDTLVIEVLDDLGHTAQKKARQATTIADPEQAFRALFTGACQLDERETVTVLRLGSTSPRAQQHLYRLVADMLRPATDRLRQAGKLRPGITVDDIVTLIRMADIAETPEQRTKAIEIILDGLITSQH